MRHEVRIIGGSIGGLSAAALLRGREHDVRNIGRAPGRPADGARAIQPFNMIRAMHRIGPAGAFRAASQGRGTTEIASSRRSPACLADALERTEDIPGALFAHRDRCACIVGASPAICEGLLDERPAANNHKAMAGMVALIAEPV